MAHPFRFVKDVAEQGFRDAGSACARQERGEEELAGEGKGTERLGERARRGFVDGLLNGADRDSS